MLQSSHSTTGYIDNNNINTHTHINLDQLRQQPKA